MTAPNAEKLDSADELRALCAMSAEPWGEEDECPGGCGRTLHLVSLDLEKRGLCEACVESLIGIVPGVLDELARLRKLVPVLQDQITGIGATLEHRAATIEQLERERDEEGRRYRQNLRVFGCAAAMAREIEYARKIVALRHQRDAYEETIKRLERELAEARRCQPR